MSESLDEGRGLDDYDGDDYAADVAAAGPTEDNLARVVELAKQQLVLEDHVADLERQLKDAKEALRVVAEGSLPEAMSAAGMKKYTLLSGEGVEVVTTQFGHISKENRPAAHAWLREHEHGDLIKSTVTVSFGRDEETRVPRLLELLRRFALFRDQPVATVEAVHPQTLGAFVREQVAKSVDLPEAITVMTVTTASIARPKRPEPRDDAF